MSFVHRTRGPLPAIGVFLVLMALLGAVVLLYWPGLDGPFLLDDEVNIGVLKSVNLEWDSVVYDVTHNFSGMLGRPVSMLSLVFTNIFHGPESWGFKYHNLLLHLLIGLLLFWLLLRLLPRMAPHVDQTGLLLMAGCTAALWLIHPLMVSTVLYAVQRMAQLSALFTLAALLAYSFLRDGLDRSSRLQFYGLSLPLFLTFLLLAVFAKEAGALIPVYVLMIEWLVYRFKVESTVGKGRLVVFQLVFVAAPLLLGTVYLLTHLDSMLNYAIRDFNILERVMTQLQVLIFYCRTILLPVISDMSLFHDGWQPVRSFDLFTALSAIFWIGWCAVIVLLSKRATVIAFGMAWFLVSHLLESTVFALELVFEHRNYLAAAGLLLIPVYLAVSRGGSAKALLLPMLALPLFAFMTHARVSEWRNVEMIYSMAVRDHPESVRALTAYASMVYSRGELDEARELAGRAIELEPYEYGSIVLQVLFSCRRDREAEIAELLSEAQRRAGLYPTTPYSLSALDKLAQFMQKGSCPEVSPAQVLVLLDAAAKQPDNLASKLFTGFIQRHIGIQQYFQGNLVEGFESFIRAYESTGWPSMLVELVSIQANLGSFESAEHLVSILEEENAKVLGAETVMVEQAKRFVSNARLRREKMLDQ